jgi:mRNA interferase HigB
MHIVTIKRLKLASEEYGDAASDIASWVKVTKLARWKNFVELKASFPDADDVDGIVVFNIRHNRYRLLTAVHYVKAIEDRITLGHVYIGMLLTHKEDDRWSRMSKQRRDQWLQF